MSIQCFREVDGGRESIRIKTPAVISADLRLNEPRYATLPNIMKAKNKPLEKKKLSDYGIETIQQTEILEVLYSSSRKFRLKVLTTTLTNG